MKAIVVSDIHFVDQVPIKRTDNILVDQFKKLSKIEEHVKRYKVDTVFLLGDIFEKARPSTWLVNKVIRYFNRFECPIYSLVGNHDLQGSRDGLPSTALGTLFEAGVILRLSKETELFGIPIKGIDHTREHTIDLYRTKRPHLIYTHNMVTPQIAPFTHVYAGDVVKASKGNFIFAGDFHLPYQKYSAADKTRLINPGVLVRTNILWKEVNPSVIYFEASLKKDCVDVSFQKLSVGGAFGDDVFDIARHEKEKTQELNLKQFIDSIKSVQFHSRDIEEQIQKVGTEKKVSQKVIDEAINRIRNAKASV